MGTHKALANPRTAFTAREEYAERRLEAMEWNP
jgi:hypothetical protein